MHLLILNLNHRCQRGNVIRYYATSILDYVFRELAISYLGKEELAHTPTISSNNKFDSQNLDDDKFLKIVKNITSKGFVRSNYEENLVDLSIIRINLKSKINLFYLSFKFNSLVKLSQHFGRSSHKKILSILI